MPETQHRRGSTRVLGGCFYSLVMFLWPFARYNRTVATIAEIEKEMLQLSPSERARIAVAAWESLARDPLAAADPDLDPTGLELAQARDADLDSGTSSLESEEFRRRTGG
ncbi:MAG: addiction module protein [Pseudomonadota bacterium]